MSQYIIVSSGANVQSHLENGSLAHATPSMGTGVLLCPLAQLSRAAQDTPLKARDENMVQGLCRCLKNTGIDVVRCYEPAARQLFQPPTAGTNRPVSEVTAVGQRSDLLEAAPAVALLHMEGGVTVQA